MQACIDSAHAAVAPEKMPPGSALPGVIRRQAVDISPLRRVNSAIYLITTGAVRLPSATSRPSQSVLPTSSSMPPRAPPTGVSSGLANLLRRQAWPGFSLAALYRLLPHQAEMFVSHTTSCFNVARDAQLQRPSCSTSNIGGVDAECMRMAVGVPMAAWPSNPAACTSRSAVAPEPLCVCVIGSLQPCQLCGCTSQHATEKPRLP